jgi:peptide/nickel transport system permease protein
MNMMDTPGKIDIDFIRNSIKAWNQTISLLKDIVTNDLSDISKGSGFVPAKDLLKDAYMNSFGLLAITMGFSILIGFGGGIIAAVSKKKWVAGLLVGLTIFGIAMPSFFAGILFQQGSLSLTKLLGHRVFSLMGVGWDYRHLTLPVLVLSARPIAYLIRAMNNSLRDIMNQDYIRTAYAKGLTQKRTIFIHALKNIFVPLFTAIGVSLRFSLSSLPVVEYFFSWQGVGYEMLNAIKDDKDYYVALLGLSIGISILLLNLLLDLLYRIVDPRMREEKSNGAS